MNIQLLRKEAYYTVILFFIISILNNLSAQVTIMPSTDKPYLYLSAAYVTSSPLNQGTIDPFYEAGTSISADKTVRADLGLQIHDNLSVELGYMRTPLWITRKLTIDNQAISAGGSSRARISFYSLRLKHRLTLSNNRFFLNTGLGYALGNSSVSLNTLGPSSPQSSTSFGNSITSLSTLEGLHNGTSNFITFDLGLEFVVHKKISLFSNVSIYKGFTDLQGQTIDYTINDTAGTFTSTTDGSFLGLELGLKFSFR